MEVDVSDVTMNMDNGAVLEMEHDEERRGLRDRWTGHIPPAQVGEVSTYRIRVQQRDPKAPPMWASDSDPRTGGQEFVVEAAPPPSPEWVRDALCYHVMVDRFARPGESLPPPGDSTALYGGTLAGIREHIHHLETMGCNLLWLNPLHKNPSHYGYDPAGRP